MKKTLSFLLSLCLLFSLLAACAGTPDTAQPTGTSSPPKEPAGPATVLFTDSAGREVEVPADITRIVPTGTMAQVILFALAPEMFVGLSSEWSKEAGKYLPVEYYNLPVLGQFYGAEDLNLEQIAAADPQVIIDVGEPKKSVAEDMDGIMNQLGIPTVHISAHTDTFADAYRMLGKLLGKEDEAEELARYCEEVYGNTLAILDKVGQAKANVIYCLGGDGLNVIAKGSYHAEIIDLLTNNLAVLQDPSSKGSGNPVDMEQLLIWDPDIIIFAPQSAYADVGKDPTWRKLTAIENGTYYETPFGPHNWLGFPPSIQRYMGMIWLTQLLYPDVAGYDLYEETARFYKLFYHCDLTKAQYEELMANSILKK